MGNPLRDPRLPSELAANGQLIDFSEKLCNLERLASIVEADLLALEPAKMPQEWRDLLVAGRLEFAAPSTRAGLPVVNGHVTATVYAVCQRCLEPFRMPLEAELRFALAFESASDDPAEDSPDKHEGYEVWEIAGETLRPLDLVEEALIMELPFSAMHSDMADCSRQETITGGGEKTTRPFAGLKAQMENED